MLKVCVLEQDQDTFVVSMGKVSRLRIHHVNWCGRQALTTAPPSFGKVIRQWSRSEGFRKFTRCRGWTLGYMAWSSSVDKSSVTITMTRYHLTHSPWDLRGLWPITRDKVQDVHSHENASGIVGTVGILRWLFSSWEVVWPISADD